MQGGISATRLAPHLCLVYVSTLSEILMKSLDVNKTQSNQVEQVTSVEVREDKTEDDFRVLSAEELRLIGGGTFSSMAPK